MARVVTIPAQKQSRLIWSVVQNENDTQDRQQHALKNYMLQQESNSNTTALLTKKNRSHNQELAHTNSSTLQELILAKRIDVSLAALQKVWRLMIETE